MANHDKTPQNTPPLLAAQDLFAAIGLLTRLPVRLDTAKAVERGARAAWAWPLVGVLPALAGGLSAIAALSVGLPTFWAATVALFCQIMITGAMHEDGLADTADGVWGGMTRSRRLEIMKDSHIGTYGVIALILSILLRMTALIALFTHIHTPEAQLQAFLAVGILSRIPMVVLMASLPNARGDGLAQSVGAIPKPTALLGTGLGLGAVALIYPSLLIALIAWVSVTSVIFALIAKRKIGGQTGDILGASQQIAEITGLAVIAASLT